jgi:hypothetical protein
MNRFLSFVVSSWTFVAGLFRGFPWIGVEKRFKYEVIDDLPDRLKANRVYLAGENGHLWAAAMLCPCGCGDTIELNLLQAAKPCWEAHMHEDGLVSLKPSVWRQNGCRSHFVLQRGIIKWH